MKTTLKIEAALDAYRKHTGELLSAEEAFVAGYCAAVDVLSERNAKQDDVSADTTNIPYVQPAILSSVTSGTKLKEHQGLKKQTNCPFDYSTKSTISSSSVRKEFTNRISSARLAQNVAACSTYSKTEVQDCLYLILNAILDNLFEGNEVVLDKFGVFKLKYNKPRQVVNPFYGKFISEPSLSIRFTLNRELNRYVSANRAALIEYLNNKESVNAS